MPATYVWSPSHGYGHFNHKIPAQVVGEFLENLRAELGHEDITTDIFVDAIAPPDAPPHDIVDWNNDSAGHQWRLQQTRWVFNSLQKITIHNEQTIAQPSNVSVVINGRRAYVPTSKIYEEPDLYQQAMAEIERYITGFRRRYQLLGLDVDPILQSVIPDTSE